ncbi:MAG: FAD-dependent oxidoreductase [Pirellulales bacterium]|nr:FAD-dependent oxidoreductase [Pirellulales bacterium]
MSVQRIVVLGGGFAGLWSAAAAARQLDALGLGPDVVEVTLVNRDAFHGIRVRNYEAAFAEARVPLDDVLQPIGVRRVEGEVADIRLATRTVLVRTAGGVSQLAYDRLIFALGSQLVRPPIPGLAESAFDVDTYRGAERLNTHLHSLLTQPDSPSKYTALVIGAGLTGIETATELIDRLRTIAARDKSGEMPRVILADRNRLVGSDMGDSARPVIEQALAALGVEMRLGIEVAAVDAAGVTLKGGEKLAAATVVWCAGMRANPLTELFPVERDRWGRLPVDESLRVRGVPHVFAAGDSASVILDEGHASVMSCQHGRPMGRFAGHNAVCDLRGAPLLPLAIDWYVTVLDLGAWGAVYTEGWERRVVAQGAQAKRVKQTINCQRIYPPLSRDRRAILDAAAPVVERPPSFCG